MSLDLRRREMMSKLEQQTTYIVALLQRRRMMMEIVEEETDLTGWDLGKGMTSANYLVNDDTLCVSPYYDIQGGDIIEVKAFKVYNNNHQCKIMELNGDTRVFQTTMTTVPYSRTTASDATRFRCVCSLEVIDDCYIKINNVYIWKGKNVK